MTVFFLLNTKARVSGNAKATGVNRYMHDMHSFAMWIPKATVSQGSFGIELAAYYHGGIHIRTGNLPGSNHRISDGAGRVVIDGVDPVVIGAVEPAHIQTGQVPPGDTRLILNPELPAMSW